MMNLLNFATPCHIFCIFRNTSADASVGSETLTRTTSRARRPPGWLTDSTNLQTPAQARGRRGVLETPANPRDPGLAAAGLMTPMITPKCDTSNLSRTVTRLAKKDEVCFSLTGSPVAPYTTNKSKVGALTIYKLGLSCCPVAWKPLKIFLCNLNIGCP